MVERKDVHILPKDDTRSHIESAACACRPTVKGDVVSHNAFDGREMLEPAPRPRPWLPSPDDVQDAGGHVWFDFDGLTCCKRCAVVRRRDGMNRLCKGTTGGIGLRGGAA